jgi:hypothetical protein
MADKNDVLEQLLSAQIPQLVTLEPATDEDITQIEEAILVPIRGDYRDFLKEAAHLVLGQLEPAQANDPGSRSYLPEVATQAWESGLDRSLLAICETEGGYYCLTLDDEIQLWQDGELQEDLYRDIWEWAETVWLDCSA